MTNFMNPAFLNAACARPAQDPEEEQTPNLNNENPEEQPEEEQTEEEQTE